MLANIINQSANRGVAPHALCATVERANPGAPAAAMATSPGGQNVNILPLSLVAASGHSAGAATIPLPA